jgi:hypothetical protein
MKCATGLLRAYLDGALNTAERAEVSAHLDTCQSCSKELAALQARRAAVSVQFDMLEPAAGQVPAPARALARFHAEHRQSRPTLWTVLQGAITMSNRTSSVNRWRPAAIGVSVVVILAILFSFAPVREVAADFLGLFRVRKFAVIPLDQQQIDRLAVLAEQFDTDSFGDPQITRPEGPEQIVADAGQAAALAGFNVRTPDRLPEAAVLEKIAVQAGPAMHFEIDRAALEIALQAAGARTNGLPQTEKLAFDVDVASSVLQQYRLQPYRLDGDLLDFLQVPSPAVSLPEGIDPTALAETAFLFLGMPADDARRMAGSIDWSSTLVIPLPTEAAQAREVSVDGATGLLIESAEAEESKTALLWERDGILHFLSGTNVDIRLLLDMADSLK